MNRVISVVSFAMAAFSIFLLGVSLSDAPVPSIVKQAKVVRVIDGDTLEVAITTRVRLRLRDCWAPESKKDGRLPEAQQAAEKQKGLASKANLEQLALGKDIIFRVLTSEDFSSANTMGRFVADAWLIGDKVTLSEKQVAGGFATFEKRDELK